MGNAITNRRIWAWLGLMTAVLVVLAGAGCQRRALVPEDEQPTPQDEEQPIPEGQTPISTIPESGLADPDLIYQSLLRETTSATESIRRIQPDAVLSMVSSKYINSLSNTFGLSTNYYIFSSQEKPDYYYLVNVPRNGDSPKRFIMPVEDFDLPFSVLPIPLDRWKVSYVAALQKVETSGGAAFRGQHKTFDASVILAIPAAQRLSWFVTYKATDGTGAVLKVQVDAETGDVQIV